MPSYPWVSAALANSRACMVGRNVTAWWNLTGTSLSSGRGTRATRSSAPDRRARAERDGEVLHAVDERRLQSLRLPVEVHVGHPIEEVLEHDPDLHSGEVRAETEMRTSAPEGHVVVGTAPDV